MEKEIKCPTPARDDSERNAPALRTGALRLTRPAASLLGDNPKVGD